MYVMKDVNGVWTMPVQPGFASDSIDNSPVYSPDGNKLYFSSNKVGCNEILLRYTSKARLVTACIIKYGLSVASRKSRLGLCNDDRTAQYIFQFILRHSRSDIYRSSLVNGHVFRLSKDFRLQINTAFNEVSPYIDPHGEIYYIYGSNRTGSYGLHDVYISFKRTDGTWTPAQNMGDKINGTNEDSFPWVTPDGKYLFFNSAKTGDLAYNAYWVDSKVIDRLKPVGINNTGEIIPKEYRLFQNHPNPFNPVTKIRLDLPTRPPTKGPAGNFA